MKLARFWKVLIVAPVALAVMLPTLFTLAGCGEETTTTGGTATTGAGNMMADRALKVLITTPTSGEYTFNQISGADLVKKLADAGEKGNIYLLDIRKKADYDKGHIADSTQVEFPQWASSDNLAKYPKDKKIVVICYTGNTAAQTVAGLRMLGFDAVALKGGMNGWAQTNITQQVVNDLTGANNPVVNTPSTETFMGGPTGAAFDKPADSEYKQIADKANSVFSAMPTDGDYALNTITPAKLNEKLGNPSEKGKLYLLDIRKKEDYEKVGHIDGAVQMDFGAVAVPENLKKLPKDKKIVVICYTGNTAAQAMTLLRMLDYDAVVMKYGMMGWTKTPNTDPYLKDIQGANNPVVQ